MVRIPPTLVALLRDDLLSTGATPVRACMFRVGLVVPSERWAPCLSQSWKRRRPGRAAPGSAERDRTDRGAPQPAAPEAVGAGFAPTDPWPRWPQEKDFSRGWQWSPTIDSPPANEEGRLDIEIHGTGQPGRCDSHPNNTGDHGTWPG